MKPMTLIAISIAALFAVPLAALAAGDKASSGSSGSSATQAQSAGGSPSASGSSSAGGSSGSSSGATKSDGGAEAMFKALDKNQDGYISKEEAKGTPHDKDFSTLDKDHDGKLSREEHAAAPEHSGDKASAGSSAGDTKGSKY